MATNWEHQREARRAPETSVDTTERNKVRAVHIYPLMPRSASVGMSGDMIVQAFLQYSGFRFNVFLNLEQDARLPGVQFRDLVKLHHARRKLLLILLVDGFDDGVDKFAFTCGRKGGVLAHVFLNIPLGRDRVLWYGQSTDERKIDRSTFIASAQREARNQYSLTLYFVRADLSE